MVLAHASRPHANMSPRVQKQEKSLKGPVANACTSQSAKKLHYSKTHHNFPDLTRPPISPLHQHQSNGTHTKGRLSRGYPSRPRRLIGAWPVPLTEGFLLAQLMNFWKDNIQTLNDPFDTEDLYPALGYCQSFVRDPSRCPDIPPPTKEAAPPQSVRVPFFFFSSPSPRGRWHAWQQPVSRPQVAASGRGWQREGRLDLRDPPTCAALQPCRKGHTIQSKRGTCCHFPAQFPAAGFLSRQEPRL